MLAAGAVPASTAAPAGLLGGLTNALTLVPTTTSVTTGATTAAPANLLGGVVDALTPAPSTTASPTSSGLFASVHMIC